MLAARLGRLDGWALALTMASIAAMACFESSDGDLGFHLATGREVLSTGRIPATNVLSYTHPEHPWLLHQWLPATLFELAFRAGGIAAVLSLKMALVTATFFVLFSAARALGAGALAAGAACLLSAAACSFRFEARPLLWSQLLLAVVLLLLARVFREAQTGAAISRVHLGMLAGTYALACQLHAGAVYAFIALVVAALGCAVEGLRARLLRTAKIAPHGARPALSLAAAAVIGALVAAAALELYHPVGARILLFPFDMATDAYLAEHLVEFRPPYRFAFHYLAGFWLLLVLGLVLLSSQARRMHAAWLGLWLAFALLALQNVRLVFPFAVVSAPLLAACFARSTRLRLARAAAAMLLLALAIAGPLESFRKVAPGFGFAPPTWPLAHFDRIRELGLRGHVFASDAWAGPLLGFFYPAHRAFFDNRIDAYPRAFVRVYQDIRYGKPGWDAQLARHDVQLVLMRYTTAGEYAYQAGKDNLRQHLANDPRWALLFFDDWGVLFARRDGENQAQARALSLLGIDPDRRRFAARPRDSAAALMRALARGPRSSRMLGMAALAVADAGQRDAAEALLAEATARAPDDPWLAQLEQRLRRSR